MITMLLALLFWHALADYPLQGDFLAKAKAKAFEPLVPWYQAMGAHCLIHASGVLLITGSVVLCLVEFVAHFMIDRAKVNGRITFNQDQALHIACKVGYIFLAWLP